MKEQPKNLFNDVPEDELGLPATDPDDFKAGRIVTPQEHIDRLKASGDPVLAQRAYQWEEALINNKQPAEIVGGFQAEKIITFWKNLKDFSLYAYGGTGYIERIRRGEQPMDSGIAGTREGLDRSGNKISYGVAKKKNGGSYLILRKLLDVKSRGGYPYTLCLDFGEDCYEAVDYNYALILKNILDNEELINKLMQEPEGCLDEEIFKILADANWEIPKEKNEKLEGLIKVSAEQQSKPVTQANINWPSPEEFARALENMPKSQRKNFTWLIGGGQGLQKELGLNFVYEL